MTVFGTAAGKCGSLRFGFLGLHIVCKPALRAASVWLWHDVYTLHCGVCRLFQEQRVVFMLYGSVPPWQDAILNTAHTPVLPSGGPESSSQPLTSPNQRKHVRAEYFIALSQSHEGTQSWTYYETSEIVQLVISLQEAGTLKVLRLCFINMTACI